MNKESLEQLIASHPTLIEHANFVRGMVRPSVRITLTKEAASGIQSQFGGSPMVPSGFQWPEHDVGLYYFLGQINFSEIENRPDSLPATGLLSLFNADYNPSSDSEEEVFWGEEGYVKAWYFEDLDSLTPMRAPHGREVPEKRITLIGELDIPRHEDMLEGCPFEPEILEDLVNIEGELPGPSAAVGILATDYLLGYPSYYSLGYNPTPGPEWVSLLTIDSYEAFNWCWQDGAKLMVFIEQDKLLARDFSNLLCDAG
ncbi:YwqG family protein [Paenalcaligenes sp. Me131]|uniref:YwqG family protein n=1 Tax=Paenalcaligenes sp. Me131 TaxID=3392636 RepID=UPI003D2E3247